MKGKNLVTVFISLTGSERSNASYEFMMTDLPPSFSFTFCFLLFFLLLLFLKKKSAGWSIGAAGCPSLIVLQPNLRICNLCKLCNSYLCNWCAAYFISLTFVPDSRRIIPHLPSPPCQISSRMKPPTSISSNGGGAHCQERPIRHPACCFRPKAYFLLSSPLPFSPRKERRHQYIFVFLVNIYSHCGHRSPPLLLYCFCIYSP